MGALPVHCQERFQNWWFSIGSVDKVEKLRSRYGGVTVAVTVTVTRWCWCRSYADADVDPDGAGVLLEVSLEISCRSNWSSKLILVNSINLCDSVRISIGLSGSKLILVINQSMWFCEDLYWSLWKCDSVRICIDLWSSKLIFAVNQSMWFCVDLYWS